MKCSKCNKEFEQEYVFCPHCGERLINNVIDIVDEEVKEEERGPWKRFAKVGYILGNISIPIFWFISLGTLVGMFGIIFSALGKRSKIRKEMADTGFKRSLTATILSAAFSSLIYLIGLIARLLG